jgi:uncharacterized protein
MKFLKCTIAAMAFVGANAFAQGSPEQDAAVKEMLEAMNFKQTMRQMMGAMGAQMPQMMDQMLGNTAKSAKLSETEVAELNKSAKEAQAKAFAEMNAIFQDPEFLQSFEGIMARAYAANFSVDEIKGITAFYKSPAGAKMLATQPQLMQQTMPEMMSLIAPKMNAIVEKTTKELVAKVEKKKQEAGGAKK